MQKTYEAKLDYQKLVDQVSPNSKIVSNCIKAFGVGGIISVIGQLIQNFYKNAGVGQDEAAAFTSITLVLIGVILTGVGVYPKLGKFSGAGSAVPITGFANSVAAPAIEFKKEGHIMGVGAKMFILAGPVIVFGTLTSMVVGSIYFFSKGGF